MKRSSRILGTALAVGLGAAALMPALAKDRALVFGVNHYTNLPKEDQLEGSINDTQLISQKLRTYGFDVQVFVDADATKGKIVSQLKRMQSISTPGDRFVFYFAGHGTKNLSDSGVILPSDANAATESNYLDKDELYNLVHDVPARGRTILLDSCFSGAMGRGLTKGITHHLHARYVDNFFKTKPGETKKSLQPVNDQQNNTTVAGGHDICYFTAALDCQRAYEDEYNNKADGLFTHYLATHLDPTAKLRWDGLSTPVISNVSKDTEAAQTPKLSDAYAQVALFDGIPGESPGPAPAPAPPPTAVTNLWDMFSTDNADPSLIKIATSTSQVSIPLDTRFKIYATLGPEATGYLVVLEHAPEGKVRLLYPQSGLLPDSKVIGGLPAAGVNPVTLPGAHTSYIGNYPGNEMVKAIFFTKESDALQVLRSFPAPSQPDDIRELGSIKKAAARELVIKADDEKPYATAQVTFEEVDNSH